METKVTMRQVDRIQRIEDADNMATILQTTFFEWQLLYFR